MPRPYVDATNVFVPPSGLNICIALMGAFGRNPVTPGPGEGPTSVQLGIGSSVFFRAEARAVVGSLGFEADAGSVVSGCGSDDEFRIRGTESNLAEADA